MVRKLNKYKIIRFWNLFQFAGKQNIRYCSTDVDFQIMKADCECPLYFSDKVFYTEFNRISCEAAFGYEQVAKRMANIRLNKVRQAEENIICEKSMLTQEVLR